MAVYNGQKYLAEAVDSILNQTFTNFEFLIINDGSTDNSREIILSFDDPRIRIVDNPDNIGLARSLNRGLQLAQGELIARQDADDISYPNRIEQQFRFLEMHPEVILLGTGVRTIDESGRPHPDKLYVPTSLTAIRWYLMFGNAFAHTSVMFRRNIIWDKLGGYDEVFDRIEDYELWSRVARSFIVENLPNVLIDYRYHYGSITSVSPPPMGILKDLVHNNLQVFLQSPTGIPAEWAPFLIRFRRRENFGQNIDWKKVVRMYEQIFFRYCQLYPEAKFDKTIRSHLATSFYWIAYYSAPRNRRISFKYYLRARKLAAKADNHPPLLKYLALWSVGEVALSIYHRLNR